MTARAVTLLELLVALALCVVVGGLALPVLLGRVEEVRTDTGVRQVIAASIACRAEAQRRGVPMELSAVRLAVGDGLVFASLDADADEEEGGDEHGPARIRPWCELPEGIRVSLVAPRSAAEVGEGAKGDMGREGAPGPEPARRLAVFMPDGSAITVGPTFLIVDGGPVAFEVGFGRWSGSAVIREITLDGEGAGPAGPPPVGADERGGGAGGGGERP